MVDDVLIKGFQCPNRVANIIKDIIDKPWSRGKLKLKGFDVNFLKIPGLALL